MERNRFVQAALAVSLIFNITLAAIYLSNRTNLLQAKTFDAQVKKYPFLSKRILNEFPQDLLINFYDLRITLQKMLKPYGDSFGLYFEYLPTGTSISINGNNEFHAASLFKLPVIMAYYHMLERTHRREDPTITLTKDMLDDRFGNLYRKGAGYKLKASEAVRLAIVESDNTAVKSLVPMISKEDFDAVYEGLDINLDIDHQGALLSAKSYSSILKALYLAAVLNKDDSEHILDLLTKTKFPDKLVAGVNPSVPVAHKIGDFATDKQDEGYRDCGIVYVPRRPYMLCMYSVSDESTAQVRMQQASKVIYDFVISQ